MRTEYRPGGVYEYRPGRSVCIVEIVKVMDDTRGVAEVRFLNVITDCSGNGYFSYLRRTGGTMNASLEYLHPVETEAEKGQEDGKDNALKEMET